MATRDDIIERIKKLQRLNTQRGATEAEALTAASLAQKLILEHNITQTELSIRVDAKNCIKDAFVSIRAKQPSWTRVAINIERLYGTICWMERKMEDVLDMGFEVETVQVVYYGFPVDVAGSIATLSIIALALETELEGLPRKTKSIARKSFEIGFCDRINERLKEMRQRSSDAFRNASKGALVVLKEQLVQEEFNKLGVTLTRSKTSNTSIDANAYRAGRNAGNGCALDTRVQGRANNQLT